MMALRTGRSPSHSFFRHSNVCLPVCKTTAHYLHACGDDTQQHRPVGFITAYRGTAIVITLDFSHTYDLSEFCLPSRTGRSEGKWLTIEITVENIANKMM